MRPSLINIGISKSMPNQLIAQIRISNILLFILMGASGVLLFPILYEDGWAIAAYLDIFSFFLFSFSLLLNYFNYNKLCRLIIVIYPPVIITIASIVVKIQDPEDVFIYDYFDARILVVGFSILPFILFSFNERKYMFSSFAFAFLLVVTFDPIHSFCGVGYTVFFGAMPKAYIVTGIYINVVLIFIAASIFYFLSNIKGLLHKNILLADDLGNKNMELSVLFEELEDSNTGLKRNSLVIKEQKNLLEKNNLILAQKIEKKTAELRQSNKELIRHNNELQQFSNTLSHNLRSPVANLMGLSQLFVKDTSKESRNEIAGHILKSATTLDGVIKDLNKVVDVKNNLHQVKEKIDIKKEIEGICFALDQNIKKCNGKLILDIDVPILYGIRSYFNSVLYNLISNAIKYRNNNRDCIVRISTTKKNDICVLKVQDNGLGLNLKKAGDKIFGMYKRFHNHIDGKGLGLFLTKQQVEAMSGKIYVESKLNIGTLFSVELPSFPLSQIKSQLFYSSEVADIYLDAINNITTLLWLKMPSPVEFKDVFRNNIEIFTTYKSDFWIIDLSSIIKLTNAQKQWMLNDAIGQYVKVGIKKVAVIRKIRKETQPFWEEFFLVCKKKSIDIIFSENTTGAKEKLLNW